MKEVVDEAVDHDHRPADPDPARTDRPGADQELGQGHAGELSGDPGDLGEGGEEGLALPSDLPRASWDRGEGLVDEGDEIALRSDRG